MTDVATPSDTLPAQQAKGSVAAYAALEISPLFEEFYSGIPIVTAQLARYCLQDRLIDWIFLYGSIIVPHDMVRLLLARRSGASQLNDLADIAGRGSLISLQEAQKRTCIWPNVKSMGGKFGREAFIIHDLSTLLTPEYHHPDSIAHHADRILADCATSERVFCVSQATQIDAITYLGLPEEQTSVLPLGVEYDEGDLYQESLYSRTHEVEPYIVVLGTIEPRKNGSIVVEMIARNPDIAKTHKIIFVGRDGWLNEKNRLIDRLKEASISTDRVIFTGFVSDKIKLRLLLNCRFAIYPSFFEGFGLPVLEATVLGKLCVASKTSSIIEVAPERSLFFDPTDPDSLADAVRAAIAIDSRMHLGPSAFTDLHRRIGESSWAHTYAHMREWVLHPTYAGGDPTLPRSPKVRSTAE